MCCIPLFLTGFLVIGVVVVILSAGSVTARILLWFKVPAVDDSFQALTRPILLLPQIEGLVRGAPGIADMSGEQSVIALIHPLGQFMDRWDAAHEDEMLVFRAVLVPTHRRALGECIPLPADHTWDVQALLYDAT